MVDCFPVRYLSTMNVLNLLQAAAKLGMFTDLQTYVSCELLFMYRFTTHVFLSVFSIAGNNQN